SSLTTVASTVARAATISAGDVTACTSVSVAGAAPAGAGRSTAASSAGLGEPAAILARERASCGSGSGYVPSYSIGFCVATTTNGSGSGRATPSTLTWRSCIASSSAACVLGGVRLISSASRRLVNTGPGRNASSPARNVIVPV